MNKFEDFNKLSLNDEDHNTICLKDIISAQKRINKFIIKTPLIYSNFISEIIRNNTGNSNVNAYLKLESYQETGSFKYRGALNAIITNQKKYRKNSKDKKKKIQVIAASTGNHAIGVAKAAKNFNYSTILIIPKFLSLFKQKKIKEYNVKIKEYGTTLKECIKKSKEIVKSDKAKRLKFIHPFNDKEVIAGQGTIGLEILDDNPDTNVIVGPIGGGGLMAGITIAVNEKKTGVKLIGSKLKIFDDNINDQTPETIININKCHTIAEGIFIPKVGSLPKKYLKNYVEIIPVTIDNIQKAIACLDSIKFNGENLNVEGAGAASLALIFESDFISYIQKNFSNLDKIEIVFVITGKNIDPSLKEEICHKFSFENKEIIMNKFEYEK